MTSAENVDSIEAAEISTVAKRFRDIKDDVVLV